MDYKEQYRQKFVSVEHAVEQIKDGDTIMYMGTMGEPYTFMKHLHQSKAKDIVLYNSLPLVAHSIYGEPEIEKRLSIHSTFFSRSYTQLQKQGLASYVPCHLQNCGTDVFDRLQRERRPLNIYVAHVTPMDSHGYFNTGTTCLFNRDAVAMADLVIVEVNEKLPYTYGDTFIHISEVDLVFQGENYIEYLQAREVTPTDRQIGQNIAQLIQNGSTIQLGIGSIPNAVALELKDKKDLGVHTEMLNDAIVKLYQAGVVNNRNKTLYPHRMVTTFTYGSKETYDFIDRNNAVLHLNVSHVNAPHILAQNNNLVSVNTTLQVDLMGQCASEAIGTLQISGTGGQVDTATGARMALGGKSIIALHSTAMVRGATGQRVRKSTIQAVHPAGTIITMPRSDIDYVVTEYGVAPLRGVPVRQRADALISIAHPDYRQDLRAEARKYHLL